MDKNRASQILDVSIDADHHQVNLKYQERITDLRQSLSDAPSHLRSKYQDAIDEAEKAYRVLVAATAPDAWLPVTEKVQKAPQAGSKETVFQKKETTQPTFQYDKDQTSAKANQSFIEKNAKWFFMSTIVGLAASVFLGMNWFSVNKKLKIAEPHSKLVENYPNGKFNIKNESPNSIYLIGYKVYYTKDDSLFVSHDSSFVSDPLLIQSGRDFAPTQTVGSKAIYDGEVLFYMVIVANEAQTEQKAYSGICKDKDEIKLNPKF